MSRAPLGAAPIAIAFVLALGGCGGDGDDTGPAPTAAPEPTPPAASVTLSSSDERGSRRDEVIEFGKRTTFRGRVTRNGAPLANAAVALHADPHPFDDEEQVVARTTSGPDGRFVARARFDRNSRVRAHVDGAPASSVVVVRRGIQTDDARVRTQPDGRQRMTGTMRWPRDVEPGFRFALFVGPASRPRLPRQAARVAFEERGTGRGRVSVAFRAPVGRWQAKLCVFPAEETGLSGPRVECRGRSTRNEAYDADRERRREEDEAREG